jgi:trimeric autotransporter adhesin
MTANSTNPYKALTSTRTLYSASSYWVLLSFAWLATATYAEDQNAVGTDGILYTSLQNGNIGNDPATSPAYWVGTSAAAAASAVAAAASAAAALVSENAAAADAIATAADVVQTGLDAAATAADAIATAADRVQTGLDAAATAADVILTNADAVATAADRVQTGLDAAATSADAIATAADRVQTGLDVIATNADAIATAADAIATAADVVQTGLDVVATSADVVQTGLDVTAAAGSASAASGSASAAAASAVSAAASYDAFDDRYLGDKASDPTLDNDGNALLTGALYFNTTSDVMKVYDGSAWNIAAISSASPTFTGTVTADGLSLGDNDKATFGNSNDLQIYHDGSHSYIRDVGTGLMRLTAQDFLVEGSDGSDIIYGVQGGATTIYHSGATKLATTATGIDVTGTATMDGLTVDGTNSQATINGTLTSGFSLLMLQDNSTNAAGIIHYNSSHATLPNQTWFKNYNATGDLHISQGGGSLKALTVATNGDISFYEDTGTTPKFFWDASAERLGVGNSSPAAKVHLKDETPTAVKLLQLESGWNSPSGNKSIEWTDATNTLGRISVDYTAPKASMRFGSLYNSGYQTGDVMTLTGDGNVGINITSPVNKLHLLNAGTTAISNGIANSGMIVDGGSGNAALNLITGNAGICYVNFGDSTDSNIGRIFYQHTDNAMVFSTNVAERMRIDSSGELTTTNDRVNLITVGRGAGAVATNTAVGASALVSNTTGSSNTASGAQALRFNTEGNNNVANGYQSLYSNTTGINNVADGYRALHLNTTGGSNVATGMQALLSNTTGSNNVAVGYRSLFSNTEGNNNVANGYLALYSNTTGGNNTANGREALYSNTTASNNTATGYQALVLNTTGASNVANGYQALLSNTTGANNVATGAFSLYSNTEGGSNVANGLQALLSNTTGSNNTATGRDALRFNTTASNNTASGYQALYSNTTGINNAATGFHSLYSNTTGGSNTASGYQSLYSNTEGNNNVATGWRSLYLNTTGINNAALGYLALQSNTTGNNNIGIGVAALSSNTTGVSNVAIGRDSLFFSTTGNGNTAVGTNSGYSISTGAKNTIIGAYSGNQGGLDIRTSNNYIVLSDGDGNPRQIIDASGNVLIGATSTTTVTDTSATNGFYQAAGSGSYSKRSVTTTANHYAFYNPNGQVGTIQTSASATSYNTSSDQRLKENITDADDAGSKVDAIQVRQFDWKADGSHQDYGMVAQELAVVAPEAVSVPENPEEMMGVDYSKLVPMLIKEIQSLRNRVAALEGN